MHKYFINGKALYKCIALILLADIFTDFYSSHRKFYSTVFEHTPHLPPKVVFEFNSSVIILTIYSSKQKT